MKDAGVPQESPGEAPLTTPKVRRYREQRDNRVDHILRRAHNNGVESLSAGELDFLHRASAELRYELGWDESPPEYDL
jgi:hypothetical protein